MFSKRNLSQLALLAILLLAMALRLAPWGHNRFMEDEALYAYWGLQIATGADPMLDEEPVDKPPLYPYTLALSQLIFLPTASPLATASLLPTASPLAAETAARLPSLFASLAGIALVYALALALHGDRRVGLLAALLLALSPFDLAFAGTALTDPLLTALLLAALLAAARGRLGPAGLLAGLALATKQQAALFLPLIVAIGLLCAPAWPRRPVQPPRGRLDRLRRAGWLWFVLGLALVVGGALWWDAARLQRPGFWEQGMISYGGLGLSTAGDLLARAWVWLRLVGSFWASPQANTLLFGAAGLWFLAGALLPSGLRPRAADWLLLVFALLYLALHWLLSFQPWDRYLLPLVPLLALLAARALVCLGEALPAANWRRAYTALLGLVLLVSLVGPLAMATRNELAIGGDHGAYDGIDRLAAYLRDQAPPGAVLYHYWLGYHYRFYLYGQPLRLHWYPDLDDLARDAYVYRHEPRYIAFPSWLDSTPIETALSNAGISLQPAFATIRRDGTVSFRLYRLLGPPPDSQQTGRRAPAPGRAWQWRPAGA